MNVATSEQFTFDPKAHIYRLGDRILPSVTQVLGDLGLINPDWFTERSRSRGAAVHRACELLDQGRLAWQTVHPDLVGYVKGWERFKNETGCEMLDVEWRGYDPLYLYAGTLDRRLAWNGYEWIIDIKTVGPAAAVGPKWARYQTGAYDRLIPNETGKPRKRAAILLYPDGSWRPDYHTDFYDGQNFLALLGSFRVRQQLHLGGLPHGDHEPARA